MATAAEGSSAIPSVQTSIVVDAYDGPANFASHVKVVHDKPVRPPAGGEALVRIKVRPVNPADTFSVMGLYPGGAPAEKLPATPGLEGFGEVVAVGEGVSSVKVGQRVVPLLGLGSQFSGEGSWQQYLTIDADHLVPVPDGVADEVAAQLVTNPVPIVGMLRDLKVPKGEYLIQSQASSTLGRMLIGYAKHIGIKTINVVRRQGLEEELKRLGADEVISSADEDVKARVDEITGGKGAYAGIDSVSGEITGVIISSVREGGTVLVFGAASGKPISASFVDFIFRDVTLKGWWLNKYLKDLPVNERKNLLAEIASLAEIGVLSPYIGEKLSLEDALLGLTKQSVEKREGKILLVG